MHDVMTYGGNGGTTPPILNLGIRWSYIVNFMHRPFYLQVKCTQ